MRSNQKRSQYQSGYFERTPENELGLVVPRSLLVLVASVLFLLFLVWFFTGAPWLRVKYIRIDGQPTVETKAVIDKLKGQNILWLALMRPDKEITNNQPNIKNIQILRGIPDTLIVKLVERQPTLIWQSADHWYTLDPTGFVFNDLILRKKEDGSYEFPATDLPVVVDSRNLAVKIGDIVVTPPFINFVLAVRRRLADEVNLRYVRAEVGDTTFNLSVLTDAGWSVLFDRTRSLDAEFGTLKRVLEQKRNEIHQYVDIRVRGWVYYK